MLVFGCYFQKIKNTALIHYRASRVTQNKKVVTKDIAILTAKRGVTLGSIPYRGLDYLPYSRVGDFPEHL